MEQLIFGCLIAVLIIAVIIDVRTYRIPNYLSLGSSVLAISMSLVAQIVMPDSGVTLFGAIAGFTVLLSITFPVYLLRVFGAGDVKLLAAVGAFMGWEKGLLALLCVLIMGGVFSIVMAIVKGRLLQLLKNIRMTLVSAHAGWLVEKEMNLEVAGESVAKMPYSVAILAGVVVTPFVNEFMSIGV